MTLLQNIEHFFQVTEADVIKIFIAIKNEEQIIIHEAQKAVGWIVANAPKIKEDLAKVEGIIGALNLAGNPAVSASLTAATVAATQFIGFAQAYQAGQTTTQTVASGYEALINTKAAVASALAAAVK